DAREPEGAEHQPPAHQERSRRLAEGKISPPLSVIPAKAGIRLRDAAQSWILAFAAGRDMLLNIYGNDGAGEGIRTLDPNLGKDTASLFQSSRFFPKPRIFLIFLIIMSPR